MNKKFKWNWFLFISIKPRNLPKKIQKENDSVYFLVKNYSPKLNLLIWQKSKKTQIILQVTNPMQTLRNSTKALLRFQKHIYSKASPSIVGNNFFLPKENVHSPSMTLFTKNFYQFSSQQTIDISTGNPSIPLYINFVIRRKKRNRGPIKNYQVRRWKKHPCKYFKYFIVNLLSGNRKYNLNWCRWRRKSHNPSQTWSKLQKNQKFNPR